MSSVFTLICLNTIIWFSNHVSKQQVPVAIGGPGLPQNVKFSDDFPKAGLANITATFINLMGFQAPEAYVPSLLAFD